MCILFVSSKIEALFSMRFSYAVVFTMCLHFQICSSFSTITSTNFISDAKNETLLSSDGNFKLGFFSPKNSLYRYVGVWFTSASEQNLVWVANRNNPIRRQDGVFKITRYGNIAVMNGETDNDVVWSSNITGAVRGNATAELLSSGNLVLKTRDGPGQRDIVLWQSFDYPTDTFLVGMKVGLDRRTNMKRVLSSWKSENDPSVGEYSAAVEVYGLPQLFVYKNSDPVWRGGPWNGQSLSGVLDVALNLKAQRKDYANKSSLFSYVNSTDEVYITLGNLEEIYRTFVLDSTGIARQQLWLGSHANGTNRQEWSTVWVAQKDRCDEYMRCGPSAICNSYNAMECTCLPGYKPESPQDWYLNCVEKTEYKCGKGNGEGFIKLSNLKLPDARIATFFDNLSLKECEMECLKDCNCTGYATADINAGGKGCYTWYGELNDIREYAGDGQEFYIRVDAPSLDDSMLKKKNSKGENGKKKMLRIIMETTIAVIVVVLVSCITICWWRKNVFRNVQRQKQRFREKILADSETDISKDSNGRKFEENSNIDLTFFSLDTIVAATSNFSLGKKLGEGGFGPVYKGDLANGQEIAVKRQLKTSNQGISQFKNEALLIAKLQHRNLVRLLGCCIEDEEKILIYEYMENKSLDYFIFDEMRKSQLDWQKRHKIIVEVARGMMYLHHDSRLKVIHRDLKASNILLDKEMSAKISDFGTARIFGGNQYEDNTTKIVGTYGYMSPEYALYGYFSVKSDVFSFGVLLIEIISGRKNNKFFSYSSPSSNLICHVWETWNAGRPLDIIDKLIGASWPSDEVLRCIQVGLLCIQDNVTDRPTMKDVVFMLSNKASLPSPKQPLFTVQGSTNDSCQVYVNSESPTTNGMTITLCPR